MISGVTTPTRTHRFRSDRGVAMIELLMVLPLLLGMLFFSIWIAYALYGRSLFVFAVHQAPRLGVVRADVTRMNQELIPELHAIARGESLSQVALTRVQELIATAVPVEQALKIFRDSGDGDVAIPVEYLYAATYFNHVMRHGLGAGYRFPCVLDQEQNPQGCVECRFQQEFPSSDGEGVAGGYLACRYAPQMFFLEPVAALFGWVNQGRAEWKAESFFPIGGAR